MDLIPLLPLWLGLWRKRKLVATALLLLIVVGLTLWFREGISARVGRFGLWMADQTGTLPADDPLAILKERKRKAELRLKSSTTPADQEVYRREIEAIDADRKLLLAGLTAKVESATKELEPSVTLTYSALERLPDTPGSSFVIAPLGAGLFSIEWEFTSYVIRNKEAKDIGHPLIRDSTTVSDVLNVGRAFYLGGVTLYKQPSGVFVPVGFSIDAFRLKRPDWLAAKIVLEPGDIFVGTILTGVAPNAGEAIMSMIGLNIGFFPLSLEDPSFAPVRVKDMTEKYGLISLQGVLAPIFSPFIMSKLVPTNLDITIGGKKLSDYDMLALRAVSPRLVESLAAQKR